MMKRWLVLLAAVVLAAAFGLWLLLRKDDSAVASTAPSEAPAPVASREPGTTVAPSLPTPPPALGSDPATEYRVGDVQIRDHRGGDVVPRDIPPNIHPPDTRELPSTLTHAISQKVRQVMMECVADLPREARGPQPRLEGQILVSIKEKRLTLVESTMQLRDVVGAALEPVRQCIQTRSVGLDTPAADQADIEKYSIQITFAIP